MTRRGEEKRKEKAPTRVELDSTTTPSSNPSQHPRLPTEQLIKFLPPLKEASRSHSSDAGFDGVAVGDKLDFFVAEMEVEKETRRDETRLEGSLC